MAVCQENLPHSAMLNGGGRPSPTFFTAYGHGFVPPGSQANGANGHMGQYGPEHGQYPHHHQFHGYDTASPSLQQQQQQQQQQHQQQGGEDANPVPAGTPQGQSWHYPGALHPRPAHRLEEWGQHYLPLHPHQHPANNGNTPPLHHQQHYNYPYPVGGPLEGFDPQGHGVDTSSSAESNSPPGGPGGGPGGGSGTKQLRPPFEWMKPANVQPVPGKTRTKDKYRVVYSDHQRLELEKEFHYSRYITIRRKAEIAQDLNLSERQVKIWFQNRRAKERKQNKKRDEAVRSNVSVPKLEPLDSPPSITGPHHAHGHSPNMSLSMQQQQHMLNQTGSNVSGGLSLPATSHHIPSPLPQQRFQTHRLSPASSQGMALENHTLPQTATPTAAPQLSDPAPVSCSVTPHQPHAVTAPAFEEKREST